MGFDSLIKARIWSVKGSQITFPVIHGWLAFGGPAMLTKMTEEDWVLVLEVFDACLSRRGDKGAGRPQVFRCLAVFRVHPCPRGVFLHRLGRFWAPLLAIARRGGVEPVAHCDVI
jgi:hypothetical protein